MEKKAKELMKAVRNIEVNLDKKIQRHIPVPTSPVTDRAPEIPFDNKIKTKSKKKAFSSQKEDKNLEYSGFSFLFLLI